MKLFFTILACCASLVSSATIYSPDSAEIESLKRVAAFQLLCNEAAIVAITTHDREAIETIEFVQSHSAVGMFTSNGISVFGPIHSDTSIAFIPIFPEDIQTMKLLKITVLDDSSIGTCFPGKDRQSIFFHFNYRLSSFGAGHTVLHEGMHAKIDTVRNRAYTNILEACADEVRIREFDRRIYRLFGTQHYEHAVTNRMNAIEHDLASKKYLIGNVFEDYPLYDPELDSAFGPPGCTTERFDRQTMLNLDATFCLLEKKYCGEELEAKKISYVYSLQKQGKRSYIP